MKQGSLFHIWNVTVDHRPFIVGWLITRHGSLGVAGTHSWRVYAAW